MSSKPIVCDKQTSPAISQPVVCLMCVNMEVEIALEIAVCCVFFGLTERFVCAFTAKTRSHIAYPNSPTMQVCTTMCAYQSMCAILLASR